MKAKFLPRFALAAGVTVLLVWSLSADAQQGPPPAPVKVALAETAKSGVATSTSKSPDSRAAPSGQVAGMVKMAL